MFQEETTINIQDDVFSELAAICVAADRNRVLERLAELAGKAIDALELPEPQDTTVVAITGMVDCTPDDDALAPLPSPAATSRMWPDADPETRKLIDGRLARLRSEAQRQQQQWQADAFRF